MKKEIMKASEILAAIEAKAEMDAASLTFQSTPQSKTEMILKPMKQKKIRLKSGSRRYSMQKKVKVVPAVEAYGKNNATYFSQKFDWCDVDVDGMQIVDFALSENRRISLVAQKDEKGYIIDENFNVYQIFTHEEVLEAAEKITEILDNFLNAEYEADSYSDYVIFAKKFLEVADKIDSDVKENEMAKAKQKKSCANSRQDKDK